MNTGSYVQYIARESSIAQVFFPRLLCGLNGQRSKKESQSTNAWYCITRTGYILCIFQPRTFNKLNFANCSTPLIVVGVREWAD